MDERRAMEPQRNTTAVAGALSALGRSSILKSSCQSLAAISRAIECYKSIYPSDVTSLKTKVKQSRTA